MAYARMLGNNIKLAMKKNNISDSDFVTLGYSHKDVQKLLDGSLFVSYDELEKIAGILHTDMADLTVQRDEVAYRPLIHCMGHYEKPENKDKILDFIDTYVDIEESRQLYESD